MADTFVTHEQCLLCGSVRLSQRPAFQEAYLVSCLDCSFVFSQRKPTEEELMRYYQSYPRDTALSPITRGRYLALIDYLEKYRKTNNLLDVGCGDGHFLEVAKDKGWKVYGTEFTDEAMSVGEKRGIVMRKGRLKEISFEPKFFDVITSFEVLEHIDDPQDEAKAMYAALRSGGGCYITTPNFGSFSRVLFGPKWNVICYPEHLGYFGKKTLIGLFRSVGMPLVSMATTGFSLDRFSAAVSGGHSTGKRMDESFRQQAERNLVLQGVKNVANRMLDVVGMGDTLKAEFRKP